MNKDLLFQLYSIHSPSGREKKMRRFVKRYIRENCGACDVIQDVHGNVFITKGKADTYPCLAAHLDQVQDSHSKDFTPVDIGGDVIGWSVKSHAQQGLGADDKNGIFICLECLKRYDVLKVAFFVGEETGCVGSSRCDLAFFKDCRFIIQPDRKGGHDLITSMFCGDVCSDDFVNALDADLFGYKPAQGSITDVGELVERGVGISCLNLSCGYYSAHTDHEYTVLSELENCLFFVQHIIDTCTDVYPFEYSRRYRSFGESYYGGYGSYGGYYDYLNPYEEDEDWETMDSIISTNPQITFDELTKWYKHHFVTHDIEMLKDIFETVKTWYADELADEESWSKPDTADDEFWGDIAS